MAKKIYLSPSSQWGNKYSYGGHNEAEICGLIAKHAGEALKRNGFEIIVGDNVNKDMIARVKESDNWGADIHEPIHSNAFNGQAEGTVVFASHKNAGHPHVKAVYEEVAKLSPGEDRGVKPYDGLYEVYEPNCPTVYIEVEFHDNPEHSEWIVDNVKELGEAIARGHCKAEGKEYIGPNVTVVEKPVVESKPATKPNMPATSSKTLYCIQTGAFGRRDYADGQLAAVKAKGFDAFITKVNGLYKIQVGAFEVKAGAEEQLVKVRAAGFKEAYITTKVVTSEKVEAKKLSNAEVAKEIYYGVCSDERWDRWGDGSVREERLKAAGYDPVAVQAEVNKLF